jgi:hypothetical protein
MGMKKPEPAEPTKPAMEPAETPAINAKLLQTAHEFLAQAKVIKDIPTAWIAKQEKALVDAKTDDDVCHIIADLKDNLEIDK